MATKSKSTQLKRHLDRYDTGGLFDEMMDTSAACARITAGSGSCSNR